MLEYSKTILLMAEIPHRLRWCKNPANNGINYQPQLVIAGFFPSTIWRDDFHPINPGPICIAKSTSQSLPISIRPIGPAISRCPVSVRPELRHPACSKIDFLGLRGAHILTHPGWRTWSQKSSYTPKTSSVLPFWGLRCLIGRFGGVSSHMKTSVSVFGCDWVLL